MKTRINYIIELLGLDPRQIAEDLYIYPDRWQEIRSGGEPTIHEADALVMYLNEEWLKKFPKQSEITVTDVWPKYIHRAA